MRVMPELTPSEARRVKAVHVLACAGIVAVVATKLAYTAAISYRRGVRAGERRTVKRLVAGEALHDIVEHGDGRGCCVQGHHHRGCCVHDDLEMHEHTHRGMHKMMGRRNQDVETEE